MPDRQRTVLLFLALAVLATALGHGELAVVIVIGVIGGLIARWMRSGDHGGHPTG
jgi:membrane protease YdiL (CAAX protease family)